MHWNTMETCLQSGVMISPPRRSGKLFAELLTHLSLSSLALLGLRGLISAWILTKAFDLALEIK